MKKTIKLGLSGAASWAWGTSLIMGQQIAQEKGIIAWIIWAVCNSLTLALLGLLYSKGAISPEIYNRKEVKWIALIIQLFCLVVQLNFINQQFFKLLKNSTISYIITVVIGFAFTLMVFKKGILTSVKTDVLQWIIAILSIIAIITVAITTNVPLQTFASTSSNGVLWGIWSGLILFAGPIGDVQHWQRLAIDESKKAYYIAAGTFAMYMLLILGMAFFEFSKVMDVILLVAVLCITTSTIDSIAVATHEIKNKGVGTIISLSVCIIWGLFVKIGMIDLWSSFGVIRFAFAVAILMLPFCLKGKVKVTVPVVLVTFAIMDIFAILGQITITNIAGIVSFTVATTIVGYLLILAIAESKRQCRTQKSDRN